MITNGCLLVRLHAMKAGIVYISLTNWPRFRSTQHSIFTALQTRPQFALISSHCNSPLQAFFSCICAPPPSHFYPLQGYSALSVAMALPDSPSACLIACDRCTDTLAVARRYFEWAGVSSKVRSALLTQQQGTAAVWLPPLSRGLSDRLL